MKNVHTNRTIQFYIELTNGTRYIVGYADCKQPTKIGLYKEMAALAKNYYGLVSEYGYTCSDRIKYKGISCKQDRSTTHINMLIRILEDLQREQA
jgi:hypothetical protein